MSVRRIVADSVAFAAAYLVALAALFGFVIPSGWDPATQLTIPAIVCGLVYPLVTRYVRPAFGFPRPRLWSRHPVRQPPSWVDGFGTLALFAAVTLGSGFLGPSMTSDRVVFVATVLIPAAVVVFVAFLIVATLILAAVPASWIRRGPTVRAVVVIVAFHALAFLPWILIAMRSGDGGFGARLADVAGSVLLGLPTQEMVVGVFLTFCLAVWWQGEPRLLFGLDALLFLAVLSLSVSALVPDRSVHVPSDLVVPFVGAQSWSGVCFLMALVAAYIWRPRSSPRTAYQPAMSKG